jgi:anti-sigma regulatory factor (Ser/Thr protein kinase)
MVGGTSVTPASPARAGRRLGPELALALTADSAAPGNARRKVRELLAEWQWPADWTADCVLVVSELVTNGVLQVQGKCPRSLPDLQLSVAVTKTGLLRVAVYDEAPGEPEMRPPADDEEHGRGLPLIEALAAGQWGWRPLPDGKEVWALLPCPVLIRLRILRHAHMPRPLAPAGAGP